jgi:hypothetical protein
MWGALFHPDTRASEYSSDPGEAALFDFDPKQAALFDAAMEAAIAKLDERGRDVYEYTMALPEWAGAIEEATAEGWKPPPLGRRCPACRSTNLRYGGNLTGCSDCGWHEED